MAKTYLRFWQLLLRVKPTKVKEFIFVSAFCSNAFKKIRLFCQYFFIRAFFKIKTLKKIWFKILEWVLNSELSNILTSYSLCVKFQDSLQLIPQVIIRLWASFCAGLSQEFCVIRYQNYKIDWEKKRLNPEKVGFALFVDDRKVLVVGFKTLCSWRTHGHAHTNNIQENLNNSCAKWR